MKEIPMPYIKANQTGIALVALASLLAGLPWLLAALFAVQLAGYLFGLRYNLFVALARPFLKTGGRETQAAELARFNNSLALLFLALALLSWAAGWSIGIMVFAGLLTLAAGAAVMGYCIGCTVYYQYKQFKAKLR